MGAMGWMALCISIRLDLWRDMLSMSLICKGVKLFILVVYAVFHYL